VVLGIFAMGKELFILRHCEPKGRGNLNIPKLSPQYYCIYRIKSYTIDIVLIPIIKPMLAIAESIVHDVFADDGQALTREYIDG